ncbi:MAG: hypothetical protein FJ254_07370 [Phycisphaerae bacterium]|nr:hypothetical protein [Phycisphaerae bacterium]
MLALLVAMLVVPPFTDAPSGGALEGQIVQSPPPQRDLRIAILPDRTTGRDWGLPYLDAAVEDLNRLKPDAVFCVGDLVQGYTRRPEVWQSQMDAYLSRVRALDMPWYPTAGNHDVIAGTRDPSDRRFAELYRRAVGPLWYAVDLDRLTAIVLFSDENLDDRSVQLGDEQFAWLKGQLDRAKARGVPSILLMHRPLWRYREVDWDTRVHPLLAPAGTVAVIAGHFHSMQRDPDRDGVQYHILGTCGGMIDQHPLTGQLQHISMLDLQDGTVEVWHQFAGATLPGDFVVAEDQERVFKLKRDEKSVLISGSLPEPGTRGLHESPLTVTISNPLDRPITARVTMRDGRNEEWIVPGEPAVSRTPRDTLNPAVTDLGTPVTLGPMNSVTIAARAKATIPMTVDCPALTAPLRAPEVVVELSFTDSKGRTVPVSIRRRLPIARTLTPGIAMPLEEWDWTPYTTEDAPPTMTAERSGDALVLTIRVPDDRVAQSFPSAAKRRDRATNPMVDALAVRLHGPAEPVLWTWEPSTGSVLGPTNGPAFERVSSTDGWSARCTIPSELLKEVSGINIGVADNDDTYHTQWRWLSPNDLPAALGTNQR